MTQPRWLEPLPDAELMRATDRWAIETKGVPARQLMERAGEGLARAVGKHAPAGRIAVRSVSVTTAPQRWHQYRARRIPRRSTYTDVS